MSAELSWCYWEAWEDKSVQRFRLVRGLYCIWVCLNMPPEMSSAQMHKAMFSADCPKSRDRDGGYKYWDLIHVFKVLCCVLWQLRYKILFYWHLPPPFFFFNFFSFFFFFFPLNFGISSLSREIAKIVFLRRGFKKEWAKFRALWRL